MLHHKLAFLPVCLVLTLAAPLLHAAPEDEAELARGGVPDVTAQQKYRTAFNEAHGALKTNLAECRAQPAVERRGCEREAQTLFQSDLAAARQWLRKG
ncbi:MAG: hypothetical protein ABI907_11305 [Ramlibacter sp.]